MVCPASCREIAKHTVSDVVLQRGDEQVISQKKAQIQSIRFWNFCVRQISTDFVKSCSLPFQWVQEAGFVCLWTLAKIAKPNGMFFVCRGCL